MGLWIFGDTTVCHGLAVLRQASETAAVKQHETWGPACIPCGHWMTEFGWENPFPFKCFFLPTLVTGIKMLTTIRKLFENYDHQVKARCFNEFCGLFCGKCMLYYSKVAVNHKINAWRIQCGSCDCQSHCMALDTASCMSFLLENCGDNISVGYGRVWC